MNFLSKGLLQHIKIRLEVTVSKANIPSVQEGVSGTSIEDPTYDVAAGWTAVADDDGDGGRSRRGTVVGDQVHLLVLSLHVRLNLHKLILALFSLRIFLNFGTVSLLLIFNN